MGSEVCSDFRSSRRIWQFDYEVANQVANFETKLGSSRGRHLRIPPWLKFVDIFGAVMDPFNRQGKAIPNADLEDWMALFRDKLDEKTYNFIFQTLTANQFTSRLQLKLLTPEQVDMMFGSRRNCP